MHALAQSSLTRSLRMRWESLCANRGTCAQRNATLCTGCSGKRSTIDKGMINMKTRNKDFRGNIEFELNTREFV